MNVADVAATPVQPHLERIKLYFTRWTIDHIYRIRWGPARESGFRPHVGDGTRGVYVLCYEDPPNRYTYDTLLRLSGFETAQPERPKRVLDLQIPKD